MTFCCVVICTNDILQILPISVLMQSLLFILEEPLAVLTPESTLALLVPRWYTLCPNFWFSECPFVNFALFIVLSHIYPFFCQLPLENILYSPAKSLLVKAKALYLSVKRIGFVHRHLTDYEQNKTQLSWKIKMRRY